MVRQPVHKRPDLTAHLFPEVLQHDFTTASQVGLQQDCVPLLVMHRLSDLTAQEPEKKMTDTLTLWRESKKKAENN